MASVRDSGYELVEYPPCIFSWFLNIWLYSVHQHEKKHLAGKQYQTDDAVISAVDDFFEDQDESYRLYHGNPSAATPMEEVRGPLQGRLCWKMNHILVKSDHYNHRQPMNFLAPATLVEWWTGPAAV